MIAEDLQFEVAEDPRVYVNEVVLFFSLSLTRSHVRRGNEEYALFQSGSKKEQRDVRHLGLKWQFESLSA